MSTLASTVETTAPRRLWSIDVFRGWVMFMMLAHVFGFCKISEQLPDNRFWGWLCFQWDHVAWRGMSLHDLIQPGFSFLVGTALAFSIASRRRRGQSDRNLIFHAAWRSLVLVLLGVFLRSFGREQTYWTFEDTLTQIGLGYLPLVLIAITARRFTWVAIGVILVGYWLAFALFALPASDFDYAGVGVQADWPHLQQGFAAHWNMNSNLAWWFDTWFLNLFPRSKPFVSNGGGYATLSFIPTLATMLLGLVAGRWLNEEHPARAVLTRFAIAAVALLAVGYALDATGICPNVKRIWTPSWVMVSGGWCFVVLGLLHWICDIAGYRGWAFPLVVLGMNSIVAYVMDWFMPGFIRENMQRHFGTSWDSYFVGELYSSLVGGGIILLIIWLILYWMYQRKIYVKI